MLASDIIGYLFGYAHLTNTRLSHLSAIPTAGIPWTSAYSVLRERSRREWGATKIEMSLKRLNRSRHNRIRRGDTIREFKDVRGG
jgi:hypothetical protein